MVTTIIKKISWTILILSLILASLTLFKFWQLRRAINQQLEVERQSNLYQQQHLEAQPFLTKLPIQNENYFIYYRQSQKNIQVIFNSALNQDLTTLTASYSAEIKQQLTQIGVDLETIPVAWQLQTQK